MGYESEAKAALASHAVWGTLNRAIWPRDGMAKADLARLLRSQVDELEAAEGYHEVEELADIVSIACRAIETRGHDVGASLTYRLLSRHLRFAETLPEGWK